MCFLWYSQEHNQTPENIFQNIFWNAIKHIKTFSFPKNSIFGKLNIFQKYFYTNQTEPKERSFSNVGVEILLPSLMFVTYN